MSVEMVSVNMKSGTMNVVFLAISHEKQTFFPFNIIVFVLFLPQLPFQFIKLNEIYFFY